MAYQGLPVIPFIKGTVDARNPAPPGMYNAFLMG